VSFSDAHVVRSDVTQQADVQRLHLLACFKQEALHQCVTQAVGSLISLAVFGAVFKQVLQDVQMLGMHQPQVSHATTFWWRS
jgi:hypothetical protein